MGLGLAIRRFVPQGNRLDGLLTQFFVFAPIAETYHCALFVGTLFLTDTADSAAFVVKYLNSVQEAG